MYKEIESGHFKKLILLQRLTRESLSDYYNVVHDKDTALKRASQSKESISAQIAESENERINKINALYYEYSLYMENSRRVLSYVKEQCGVDNEPLFLYQPKHEAVFSHDLVKTSILKDDIKCDDFLVRLPALNSLLADIKFLQIKIRKQVLVDVFKKNERVNKYFKKMNETTSGAIKKEAYQVFPDRLFMVVTYDERDVVSEFSYIITNRAKNSLNKDSRFPLLYESLEPFLMGENLDIKEFIKKVISYKNREVIYSNHRFKYSETDKGTAFSVKYINSNDELAITESAVAKNAKAKLTKQKLAEAVAAEEVPEKSVPLSQKITKAVIQKPKPKESVSAKLLGASQVMGSKVSEQMDW